MATRTILCLLLASFASLMIIPAYAQNCSGFAFSNGVGPFATCINLPFLNSFLHWTYHPSNHTVDIAYRQPGVTASNWVAWALNPAGSGMLQAQCLVAFQNSSGLVHSYTAPIGGGTYFIQLNQGPLSFPVPKLSAEFNGNQMIILATLQLPAGRTSFNQVWQVGPLSGDAPQAHDSSGNTPNTRSTGTVDFATGQVSAAGGGTSSRIRRRNVHGVLNAVSWGILMPIGAVIARYLKVAKSATPAWFWLHVTCQTSAYIVGVAGWGTGLKLGSESKGITYHDHRNIGIALFCLGTLQVFALLLRPKPDHKYRFYWNLYHWGTGYTVIALSIANIYKGFDILDPEKKWKKAYTGVIIAIGAVAAVLEVITWFIVLKRKKDERSLSDNNKFPSHSSNRVNGVNGYEA